MTQEQFSRFSEDAYRTWAEQISKEITIRDYNDHGSSDEKRKTTKPEQEIIFNVAYAAFVAYGHRENADLNSIMDMAEFTLHKFLPTANAYDTIYIPCKKIMGVW